VAQARSWLTIWEVEKVEQGRSMRIRDLLSGQIREVIERSASATLAPRAAFLGQVVDHGGVSVLVGIHAGSLPALDAAQVVALARRRLRRKREVPIELLRDDRIASYLITIWDEAFEDLMERASIPPKLQNTDGDPLLLTIDHYDFAATDRGAVEAALRRMGAEMSPRRGSADSHFSFKRSVEGSKTRQATIVAQVRVRDRSMRVETNSIRRADEIRRRLEDVCGALVQYRLREHTDPRSSALAGDHIAESEPPTQEMQRVVRQFKEQHYATWPDEPLPALEGMTPHQAVRARDGRDRVEVLLKDLEHAESREPAGQRYDTAHLRRELGLSAG